MGERQWGGRVTWIKGLSGSVPLAPCLLPLACCLFLFGCGYQFRVEGAGPTIGGAAATASPTSPPPRLVVRTLENKSFEPNLEAQHRRHQQVLAGQLQVVLANLVDVGQILAFMPARIAAFTSSASCFIFFTLASAITVKRPRP